jgi:hypothetical protein
MTGLNEPIDCNPTLHIDATASVTSRIFAAVEEDLRTEARQIALLSQEADKQTVEAAKKLVALKRRIARGDAGPDAKWMEWLRVNVKLSASRLAELIKIGESSDSRKALEAQRRQNREKAKKSRDKRSEAQMSEERRLLLKVAHQIPEECLATILAALRLQCPDLFGEEKTIN